MFLAGTSLPTCVNADQHCVRNIFHQRAIFFFITQIVDKK